MALSFEESKKQLSQQSTVAATPMMFSTRMMALADNWTRDTKYAWFEDFTDDKMSYVDENKDITIDSSQINISQESRSQFIPFEMPRYYDGIDLTKMAISIHFTNSDKQHGASDAVNVQYNEDKIRFAWLVDANATHVDGTLQFEIHADGSISGKKKDESGTEVTETHAYRWKTKPTDKFNVIKSLCQDPNCDPIEISNDWVDKIVEIVSQAVTDKVADTDVAQQVAAANQAVQDAQKAAADAQQVADNLQDGIATEVQNAMGDNYYTKVEVDAAIADEIAKVDISDQLPKNLADLTEDETHRVVTDAEKQTWNAKSDFSGSYNDLTDKPTNVSVFTNDAGYLTSIPEEYVTDTELNAKGYLTEHQDLSAYALKTEVPSIEGLATEQYVDDAVAAVDVSEQLKDYAKSADVYKKSEVDNAIANVQVDLSDYYTKNEVDAKDAELSSSINTNTTNISSLSNTLTELQTTVSGIDISARKTYDVAYNDTEDPDVGENVFVLYEIENEGLESEVREAKKKFTIVGGGGGSAASSSLKIEYVTKTPIVATMSDDVIITYNFSGTDSSGDPVMDGNATWKVAGKIVATNTAIAGENSFNVTQYLTLGTQKVNLSITDDAGSLVTKTWTVQKVDIRIESTFNDKFTYPIGKVSFDYTPYGAVEKDVHFKLDSVEIGTVTTSVSGIPMAYEIPAQTHGSHLFEVYITAMINGNTVESNHIVKDIIWYDESSSVPVIGCAQQSFTARQYDATNITYTVYDPKTETPTVTLAVDGDVVSTLTLDSNTQVWQYKTDAVGPHILTITCGETIKTLNVTIEKLDINVEPVTAGLAFDFNPSGRANNDADRLWSDGEVTMTVSDNFDWVNGGYQIDENGDQYFCVKSGTTAVINYNLFADDPKRNGKEFKVVFKTTNVKKRDTTFISCMDSNIGLDMKVENARIYSSNNNLYSPYCEEDIIEFEFNINKDTDIPMVLTYEDGVGNRPMIYTSDASFMQTTPKPITIGSADCDVYIYRMKAYSTSLSDRGILSNFIADARNADEMIARYNRNQIYDENGLLTPQVLAEKCPDLRIIMIDAPWFTNDKGNKIDDTNITMIYKNGDPILDNWTCTGARHSGQGTSSNEYGYAGRNLDLIMDRDTSLFTLGDGVTTSKTITLTRDSVPTDYLNVKVNIASSENQNNAQMANRYNTYNPFKRSAKVKDSKVKDTMEFYNCVVFIKERNEDIATHREFQDTNWHYYALGNVGDSKKTDDTRVNDKNDPREFVIEIMDYNVSLAEFPTGNGKDICPVENWKEGNTAYDYLYAPYLYEDGEFSSFGNESYEFRYEMKGITEEQREANINAWREMYKFVVTSTDEEFYANLKKYFVIDSALYYYLFTERYTMVDNRAKNSFWHYGKAYFTTEEAAAFDGEIDNEYIDDEQAAFNDGYRFDLTFGYDFDKVMSK